MRKSFFKRLIDFTAALAVLIILSPLLVATIALFVANGGRPFCFRERPGRNERIFRVIKFKSIIIKGFLLDDERFKQGEHFGIDCFDELLEGIRECSRRTLPHPADGFRYMSPIVLLLASMLAPMMPALSPNLESFSLESLLTRFREYFLIELRSGSKR